MNSYNSALSAYAQSAGEINSNLAGYRGDVDRVRGLNKQLKEQAQSAIDLNALKGIGEEAAVRALKSAGGRILGYADTKLFGGKIGADTEGLKNMISKKIGNIGEEAKSRFSRATGQAGEEVGEEGTEMTDLGGRGQGMTSNIGEAENGGVDVEGNLGDEALVDEPAETAGSFEDFMNQFDTPMTDTGDIDFVRSGNQLGMGQADMESRQMNQAPEEKQDVGEETKEGDAGDAEEAEDGAADMGEDATADLGDTATGALENASSGLSDGLSALTGAGETAVDSGVSAGLEGAGAALDATGIGAVVGVPLQIAGAVLEGGALVEAARSIWDWFDDDILGNAPKPPTVAVPKLAPSLAQRGMLITPNMDTLDQQPSYGGF